MSKEFEIKSKSLSRLNEAIRKASLFNVKVTKNPLKENDKFVSVLSADNSFDSDVLKNDDIEINSLTDKKQEEKRKLTNDILDKINDTLKTNKEIYGLLNKVKELNSKDDSNKWIRNKEKNTAELAKKNAKIFLQNNNICLSHDGKIEIFHSVCELHDWLKKNDYPIPEGIKLHEAKEKLHEFNILNDRGFSNAILGINPDDKLKNYSDRKNTNKPKADPDKWYLSFPIGPKGKVILNKDNIPVNYTGEKKYLKYNWENFKKFDDILTDDINQAFQFVSKKHAEMSQTRIYTKFLKMLIPVKMWEEKKTLFALKYIGEDYTSEVASNTEEYLRNNWEDSTNLFTTELKDAKLLPNRIEASDEIKNVTKQHPKLNYRFQVIQVESTELEECGATCAGLGSAVTWTANKKDELHEDYFGYSGTPQEDTWYPDKASRASDYLKWLFNTKTNYTTLDPNFKTNFTQAIEEFEGKQLRSRGNELWGSIYKSRFENDHPMFRGLIDPETKDVKRTPEYYERVKQINDRYGINLNPDEPVIGKSISPHNKIERDKWMKNFFNTLYKHGEIINTANAKKARYDSQAKQDDKIENTVRDIKNMYLTASDNPRMYGKKGANIDTVTNYLTNIVNKYKNELKDKEIYNPVIDKFIDANAEFPKNIVLDQAILDKLKQLKDAKLKKEPEQQLKEDDSPADFATGATGGNTDTDINLSTTTTDTTDTGNIDLNNMTPETDTPMDDNNAAFDDININAGNGDYGPDEEEQQPVQPVDMYQVVDVLVNTEDSDNIKVKVKNLNTDEIEIKDLSEIDI